MQPVEAVETPPTSSSEDPLNRLSSSARGWHTIQLAVLGFIGICGVLRSDSDAPTGVQGLAAVLAVCALGVACYAVFLVGRVAWPLPARAAIGDAQRLIDAEKSLRGGIRLTVVALVLIVIAALSGWWPNNTADGSVQVHDAAGQSWCGPIVSGPDDAVSVRTRAGVVAVPLETVASFELVASCP